MTTFEEASCVIGYVKLELAIKRAVRDRDDYRCIDCGKTAQQLRTSRNLPVRRLISDSEWLPEGCVTLCYLCAKERRKAFCSSCRRRLLEDELVQQTGVCRNCQQWIDEANLRLDL